MPKTRAAFAGAAAAALWGSVGSLGCSGGAGDDLGGAGDPGAGSASGEADAGSTSAATGDPAGGGANGADAGSPASDAAPAAPEPDVDAIPWATGANVGYGVASKDTQNPRGQSVFIAYAGYDVSLASAEAWTTALYRTVLRDQGVRWIWAVQGPAQPDYASREIGNSKIAASLRAIVGASTASIYVAGHSSGSFVAHELLGDVYLDGFASKLTYFDLDGGSSGLSQDIVSHLAHAYFVGSHMSTTGTYSANAGTMQSLGATYAAAGGYYENDANASGCNAGAVWCLHVTLIITKPHDPSNADATQDYSDFVARPVTRAWFDALAK